MCKHGTTEKVSVKIPADLSCTGEEEWREMRIDSCIAPLVKALQEGGIDMRGSCCGHGGNLGDIHLQDNRILLIANRPYPYRGSRTKFFLKVAFENWKYSKRIRFRTMKNNFLWRLKKLLKKKKGERK